MAANGEEKRIPPFRMAGNLYFVGTYGESSHIIDTGDGLIMIDAGYEKTVPTIIDGIRSLGFSEKDIKLILLSHGHLDHSGGVPRLLEVCKAETRLASEDMRYIEGFVPDGDYRDGEVIRLGNTSVTVLRTPGHTVGTVSFFFDVTENGKVLRCGMFGGAGTKQLTRSYLEARGLSLSQRDMFFASIDRLRKERVDLFVGNHSWHSHTLENAAILRETGENRFIDPGAWPAFLDKVENDMKTIIEKEKKEL